MAAIHSVWLRAGSAPAPRLTRQATGVLTTRAVGLGWREARPVVQAIFQLRFIAGAAFAAQVSSPGTARLAVSAVAWLCTTWSVYLLNGVHDQVEDRRNGLARPLAAGELPLPVARSMVRYLALGGLGAALLVSWRLAALAAAMLCLGWVYSAGPRPQKAHAAGFAVVVTAGGVATYLAGWYAAGGQGLPGRSFWTLAAAMSLWMGLAGNTKDISHVAGDRAAGRRTLPLLLGDTASRWVIAGLTLGLASAVMVLVAVYSPALLLTAIVLLAGAAAVAATLARAGSRRSEFARGRPYRTFMVTQYAVHAAVLVPVLAGAVSLR